MASELLTAVAGIASAVVTAGGQVGTAFIARDAQRYVAKQQTRIEQLRAQVLTEQVQQEAATQRFQAALLRPTLTPRAVAPAASGSSLFLGLFAGAVVLASAWE